MVVLIAAFAVVVAVFDLFLVSIVVVVFLWSLRFVLYLL